MSFASTMSLFAVRPSIPFDEILQSWVAARLDRRACRDILEKVIVEHHLRDDYFDLDELERGGLAATRELLFDCWAPPRSYEWQLRSRRRQLRLEISAEAVGAVAQLTRAAAACARAAELRELAGDGVEADVLDLLCEAYVAEAPHGRWPALERPGVQRREHASLLLRTEAGSLVTDPQGLAADWTTDFARYPIDSGSESAPVLITHSHGDHFHLPSIMRWVDDGDCVVVPAVPRASLLAEDLPAIGRSVFADVRAPAWWSTLRLGDVEVDVLPFYGEQPTRRRLAVDPALQNWGNCYRFNLPGWSIVLLVDSGADARGDMVEVLRRSVDERGPVDVVMSCCHEFPEAINQGLPHYAFVLPFERLEQLFARRESMTLGPTGLAEACEAAKARFFMPYAHGFGGLFQPTVAPESPASEARALQRIEAAFRARGVSTELVRWDPGDILEWVDGRPRIHRLA